MTRSATEVIAEELASLLWDVDDETPLANRILSRLAEEGFVVMESKELRKLVEVAFPGANAKIEAMLAAIDGKETG